MIATDQDSARAYARTLHAVSGEKPVVVLSDEKAASRRIAEFTDSEDRWMVAVRMVSEGVDVPRLAVGVYATTTSTPLFFAQAVGRFVRSRSRGETASVFLPSVPALLGLAAELEVERDHVLGRRINDEADIFAAEQDLLARAQAAEGASDELGQLPFQALGSEARFDHVLYDGDAYGSDEELDFLGIPGLLDRDQVKDLLTQRQSQQTARQLAERSRQRAETAAESLEQVSTHERLAVLRRELNGLVAAWHHRTGQPHGATHAALRRECGGPPAAVANAEQLAARIERVREWAAERDQRPALPTAGISDPRSADDSWPAPPPGRPASEPDDLAREPMIATASTCAAAAGRAARPPAPSPATRLAWTGGSNRGSSTRATCRSTGAELLRGPSASA